jgi:predicted N-acyltransferase
MDKLARTTAGGKPSPGKRIVRVEPRITALDAAAWDRLDHGPSPFLRHGFLRALEESGSTGPRSGWMPAYVLVEDEAGALLGATAAFVKSHSYGEYIFDWSWASAAARFGVDYYPKLVVAAPLTPATGKRILLAPDLDDEGRAAVTAAVIAGVRAIADQVDASSIHWLFCTADEQAALEAAGFAPRASYQFHWHNKGWTDFDGFLGALASRKRKQLRKERARVHAAIDGLRWIPAKDAEPALIACVDRWYRTTVEEHGGHDYLRPGFFERVATLLPDETQIAEVRIDGKRVAGALYFETPHGLYGRYWGSDVHLDCLHFETAYYAGIERCLARGIPLFEAGAQGEHKLVRGFEPSPTYSAHWLRDPRMFAAVGASLERERAAMPHHLAELAAAGPYRRGTDDDA